ncbi:MAG: riboflavin biosynthesis protein RibF [Rhodobacterales bacterium 12-64-8]|nr:MAG: riboflavin biosynthesis protein RibF [Rhodobacterales bacterium 12-64-8]OYX50211.1 MAG: riboflavin biosynthesis protein RibF [Alphaproteobacteria bacterium 32-64-14]
MPKSPVQSGAAIALGNFDGLHAGHRAVIESARAAGKRIGAPLGVATFEPSPRRHFQPDAPPFRLMTPLRRAILLEAMGVEQVHLLKFDAAMAAMTDREFCQRVIIDEIGTRSVSVGFDFRFGKNRMGDAAALQRLGAELGFGVDIVAEVKDGGEKVSSSRIREAIERGDMDEAKRGLGDWWTVDAIVEHGEKRGRTLGFPTANMQLGEIVHPAHGIYAVRTLLEGEEDWRPGVANFGRTPTTGLRDPLLEVMVFDVVGDFYGKRMHTAFVKRLRPELKFDTLEALVDQMHRDVADARAVLAG